MFLTNHGPAESDDAGAFTQVSGFQSVEQGQVEVPLPRVRLVKPQEPFGGEPEVGQFFPYGSDIGWELEGVPESPADEQRAACVFCFGLVFLTK